MPQTTTPQSPTSEGKYTDILRKVDELFIKGKTLEAKEKLLADIASEDYNLPDAQLRLGLIALRQGENLSASNAFQAVIKQATTVDNECAAYLNLGHLAMRTGQIGLAYEQYYASKALATKVGSEVASGEALVALAELDRVRGAMNSARRRYEEARHIFSKVSHVGGLVRVGRGLGYIHVTEGRIEEARSAHAEAAYHIDAVKDVYLDAVIKLQEAEVERTLRNYEKAFPLYESAAEIFAAAGDVAAEANVQRGLGHNFRAIGDLETALKCFNRCLELAKKANDYQSLANAYRGMGHILRKQKKTKEAETNYKQSLNYYQGAEDRLGRGNVSRALGELYRERFADSKEPRDFDHSHHSFTNAIIFYEEIDHQIGIANAYMGLGNLFEQSPDSMQRQQAAEYFLKASLLYDRVQVSSLAETARKLGMSHMHSYVDPATGSSGSANVVAKK